MPQTMWCVLNNNKLLPYNCAECDAFPLPSQTYHWYCLIHARKECMLYTEIYFLLNFTATINNYEYHNTAASQ